MKERERVLEVASVDQILLLLPSKSSRRVTKILMELPTMLNHATSDPRELHTSAKFSLLERRMMFASMLSAEKSKREIRPSTNHQEFKDLLPKKDLEERSWIRETN